MNKVEIIGWLAGLPDGAPELARVDAIRKGEADAPAAPAPVSTRLLTMGGAAGALGVSRQTVWRLLNEGRLSAIEIRKGQRRIAEAELQRFVRGAVKCG